jgi:hypothetical protein
MKLETFNDVLSSIKKNPNRAFHLLLGNGFSVAYDPAIFSYNALHNFVTNLKDKDLSTILSVIETRNFEVIMEYPTSTDSPKLILPAPNGVAEWLQSPVPSFRTLVRRKRNLSRAG